MPLDRNRAIRLDRGHQFVAVAQAPGQHGGTAIDEPADQPCVQGIGQTVLDRPRPLPPVHGIVDPVLALGDVGPGAHVADPAGEGVDVAVGPIEPFDLACHPVLRQSFRPAGQVAEQQCQQAGVRLGQGLAEVGDLAHVPQQPYPSGGVGALHQPGVARQRVERCLVLGIALWCEKRPGRGALQRAFQVADGVEAEIGVAPVGPAQGLEPVLLDRGDGLGIELGAARGDPEGAVVHVPTGAPGNLREFLVIEAARPPSVKLGVAGKGDMIDVHVQTHADRIGRDQEVDLAGLVQVHLGVAGARRKGAQHHGGTAALAADQFAQGVDIVGGERDHGGAPRQSGDLAGTGPGER